MSISDNIKTVSEKIEKAAQKSGRKASDITLVAVSKTVDAERIAQAVSCGVRVLGENRVQEVLSKHPLIPNVDWHLIGHLQTNKVKNIIDKVSLIHSVDSIKLINELETQAKRINKVQNVLIQINISKESTKFGIYQEALPELLETAQNLENIRVCGLMTIPPLSASESEIKKLFENCNNLFVDIKSKKYHNIYMESLSMGMTGDFETAIECGANVVRVGSGIFGNRNYNLGG